MFSNGECINDIGGTIDGARLRQDYRRDLAARLLPSFLAYGKTDEIAQCVSWALAAADELIAQTETDR